MKLFNVSNSFVEFMHYSWLTSNRGLSRLNVKSLHCHHNYQQITVFWENMVSSQRLFYLVQFKLISRTHLKLIAYLICPFNFFTFSFFDILPLTQTFYLVRLWYFKNPFEATYGDKYWSYVQFLAFLHFSVYLYPLFTLLWVSRPWYRNVVWFKVVGPGYSQ